MKKILLFGFILFTTISVVFAQVGHDNTNTNAGSPGALGNYGTAFGSNNNVPGQYAFIGGSHSEASGSHSFGFGFRVKTTAAYSFVIGRGPLNTGSISPFENNIWSSLKIGFGTPNNQPSLMVTGVGQESKNSPVYYGYVGIFTDNPGSELDVNGTITTVGFKLPTGANNNYVLTCDANGNAHWAPPLGGTQGGNGYWSLQTGTNNIYYGLNYSDKVGIGLSNPHYKLDVSGITRIKQELIFNGSDNAQIIYGTETSGKTFKIKSLYNGGGAGKTSIRGLCIDKWGNVGIGTDSPGFEIALDVNGVTRTSRFIMTQGAGIDKILVSNASGKASWKNMETLAGAWSVDGNNVYRESGNVGIGTDSPDAALHIKFGTQKAGFQFYNEGPTDADIADFMFITDVDGNDGILKIHNPNWRTKYSWSCGSSSGAVEGLQLDIANYATTMSLNGKLITQNLKLTAENVNGYILQADADGDAHWVEHWKKTTNKLTFSGNVGIGTTEVGTHALAVNGSINASEILVTETVPGSDYVFENDYKLMPLRELEAYVNTNKHLPEVKSADEFVKDGYSLGKMDDVLLRKVEELTLYMIAQQKLIDELREKVHSLEEQK